MAQPWVALAFPNLQPHLERVMQGILDYAREHGGWRLALNPEGAAVTVESLRGWRGDGILAMIETEAERRCARRLGRPLVNLAARVAGMGFASVLSDNQAIGRFAAEHLLERGFRRFAFYGLRGVYYSEERLAGFRDRVELDGGQLEALLTESRLEHRKPWEWDRTALDRWLRRLRVLGERVGLMAVHDYRAQLVLESAGRLGIEVPGEMAVIGVNNDPVACEGSVPALSSVPQDGYRMGYLAAARLDRLMRGERDASGAQQIEPLAVVARRSTDMLGVSDERLRWVLEEMGRRSSQSIGVAELARSAGVSRRRLELLFREQMGCSPHQYLVRLRLRRVEGLREQHPRMRWSELAREAGFPDTRSLRTEWARCERRRGDSGHRLADSGIRVQPEEV
jgi:LacI family transcriptional regulator